MNLTLRELFAIVAFCGVVAWSSSQMGFDNLVFWIVIGVAVAISALFVCLAKNDSTKKLAWVAGAPALLCCLAQFLSIALLIHMVQLMVVGLAFAVLPTQKPKTLVYWMMGCLAVTLVSGVLIGWNSAAELKQMRQKFPAISLEQRLKYEPINGRHQGDVLATGSPAVQENLITLESELGNGSGNFWRSFSLRLIHERNSANFMRSVGFGIFRMSRPHMADVDMPALRDIPFNDPVGDIEALSQRDWTQFNVLDRSSDIRHLHQVSQYDFLDPDGFGVRLEARREVAGFVEHAFHHSPLIGLDGHEQWEIVRLELVSLLKFSGPRVYVLEHFPRMDQLSNDDVPTRELDEFETEALVKLWTDNDLVVRDESDEIRMLGSLRAVRQCLECHQVQRGDLLGAFSYVIRPLTVD